MTDQERLRSAAAALSGEYGLDFSASTRPGCIELSATLACLKDVRDDLVEEADDVEVIEHGTALDASAGTLFLDPGEEQLELLVEREREARPDDAGEKEDPKAGASQDGGPNV